MSIDVVQGLDAASETRRRRSQRNPWAAMRPNAAGLIVPEDQALDRVLMTKDEGRLLDRATKMLAARGVRMVLGCTAETCKHAPMQRTRLANGDYEYACEHQRLVFQQKW